MKELIVDNEMILFDFLRNKLDSSSKNNIKSLLTKKMISVNGKTITKYDYLLKKDDIINIGVKSIDSSNGSIKILYEDKDILVVDKPSGLLSVDKDEETKEKNLFEILEYYVKKRNHNNKLFVVHRLDKDTSGIILFAKTDKLRETLQDNWNELAVRDYYAVVVGKTKDKETLKSYLKENDKHITYSSKDGKLAITEYKKIKGNNDYSLLDINIKTGRRNQIRVQLRDINHPIVGDTKYGLKDKTAKRMMLHAYKLKIKNPVTNKILEFTSDIPKCFNDRV